jgi:signal transduction histidine kinase
MTLWPKSLAGRLAALLVLTLIVAQFVTFILFAGERVSAFRGAYREDLLVRLVSLVALVEEAPPALHERLLATASSTLLRVSLDAEPLAELGDDQPSELRTNLAAALGKRESDVLIAVGMGEHWRERREWRRMHNDRGPPPWAAASVRLSDGSWLNAVAGRPPVPPLGHAFLASLLISAAAVALVGAFGVRWASTPLKQLAAAADRLGRGESFEPLPEIGPQETRRANVAFNRMRERLDRFIRDRTTMLAAIAHDLRTPITSLRLRAEFIDDEEMKARILETLAEMQTMTEAALTFAKGDAESEPTRMTDLAALVESAVEDARESGRDVRLEQSPTTTIACRPFALRRAVSNIIDNAALYGLRARVRIERAEGEARIVVDDDGPGIPASDIERVFEPFVRLESSRSRETGGAGLGLAIARSILRAHGGDVSLSNRPEGGLRAMAILPLN